MLIESFVLKKCHPERETTLFGSKLNEAFIQAAFKNNVFKFYFKNAHRSVHKIDFPARNVLPVYWSKDAFQKIDVAKSPILILWAV
jgi:hypothetical protein